MRDLGKKGILGFLEQNRDKVQNQMKQHEREFVLIVHELGISGAVKFMQNETDELLEISGAMEGTSCSNNCNFCCHDNIATSRYEGVYIIKRAIEENVKINKQHLEDQFKVEDLRELKWAKRKCAFVQANGSCGVYEYRPMICRTHNSTSEPIECENPDGTKYHGQKFDIKALVLNMAFNNTYGATSLDKIINEFKDEF